MGGRLSAKVTKYYTLLSAWLEPAPLSYFAPRNRMAHKAFPITILNDDRIGTFNVVSISYAYNDTTLPSGPLSVSPEEAAGLSASFQSASVVTHGGLRTGLGVHILLSEFRISRPFFRQTGETVAIPEGCREAFGKFEPWNNPQNVISAPHYRPVGIGGLLWGPAAAVCTGRLHQLPQLCCFSIGEYIA